jgi:hypothetical protein
MPDPRKERPERITATEAGRRLRISRTGVMSRLGRKCYESEVIGGVTFVVVDERFLADEREASKAEDATAAVA